MKQKSKQKLQKNPEIKQPAKKEVKKASAGTSFLDPYWEKYGLWITLGLVSLLILIIFFDFIIGNKYYLFKDIGSDTINTFYPHFIYIHDYLRTEGFPLWAFAQGMGQNIQAGSMNNPFYWIVYLGGADSIAYRIIWMEVAKIILTGYFIYNFLKLLGLKPVVITIGTLLYCFSGMIIVGGGWYIFSTEACYLALLLWSFERLYVNNSWYLFPISIALIAAVQPFNLFLYGVFFILYFLMRHFTSATPSWKKFYTLVLQMAGCSLLGLLISSFFFWSSMQMLLDSPRVSGHSGLFDKLMAAPVFSLGDQSHNMAAILRFFSNDFLGNGSNYRGWYNYLEAPLVYIGLLPLLLMPQVFILTSKRKALFYGLFFFILIFPVVFPYFRYSLWLFSGDYYRGFSLFVGLAFLFLNLFAVNEIIGTRKINLFVLSGTFILLMILLYYPYTNSEQIIDKSIQSNVRNYLVIYSLILVIYYFQSYKSYLNIILLLIVFIELGSGNYTSLSKRSVLTKQESRQKIGYNDYTLESVDYLNSTDKQFFRVNKDYTASPAIHTSFNDAKAQGYNSTMVYDSFNQKYYIMFLEEMGIITKGKETQSRWAIGFANRPFLQNLASTKYTLTKGPASRFRMFQYDSVSLFGDVKVLKNRFFLPLGFTYDKYIPLDSFSIVSSNKKDFILQQAFIADTPVDKRFAIFKQYPLNDTAVTYTYDSYFKDILNLKKDTLAITRFSQNHINGTIDLDSAKMLFLSIPYDKGWHVKINGKDVHPTVCNIGFIGLFLEPGKHEVELYYSPPYFYLSLWLTFGGIAIYLGLLGLRRIKLSKRQVKNELPLPLQD
ncbi:MAG: YfhO family protein [Bacteroidales bacterium]|nr:YfhO family protein [Bacteroidales bacterium]